MTRRSIKLYESKAWLNEYFVRKKMSITEITTLCRCSENTIRKNLKIHGFIK